MTKKQLPQLSPTETEILRQVWAHHRLVVTLEENTLLGGFGSGLLEWEAAAGLSSRPRVLRIGLPDRFLEQATRKELLAASGLGGNQVADDNLVGVLPHLVEGHAAALEDRVVLPGHHVVHRARGGDLDLANLLDQLTGEHGSRPRRSGLPALRATPGDRRSSG